MTDKLKHAVSVCSVLFTAVMGFVYLFALFLSDSERNMGIASSKNALCILLFCAVVGAASLLLKRKGTGAARIISHAVICFAGFLVLIMWQCGIFAASGKNALAIVAVLLYFILYILSMTVRSFAVRLADKTASPSGDKEEKYTSMFDNN